MSAPKVTVVDYGMGNLRSVVRALTAAGGAAEVTSEPEKIRRAQRLILPGQGAFHQCMTRLHSSGMADALQHYWSHERPYLGICLGLQVMFDASEEHGPVAGFGLVPGKVSRFPGDLNDAKGRRLKVPHMGWNTVRWCKENPLIEDAERVDWFYFVHSYFVTCDRASDASATSEHGMTFTVAVARGNHFGVQFHPEKSHVVGLNVLRRFIAL